MERGTGIVGGIPHPGPALTREKASRASILISFSIIYIPHDAPM